MADDSKKIIEEIRNAGTTEEAQTKLNNYIKELNAESVGKSNKLRIEENRILAENAKLLGNMVDFHQNNLKALEAELTGNAELTELLKETKVTLQEINLQQIESLDLKSKDADAIKERLKLYAKERDIQEAQTKFGKQNKALIDDIAGGLGINVRLQDTFLGKLKVVGNQMSKNDENGRQARENFILQLRDQINLTTILLSVMTKITEASVKVAMDFDKARASLAAATGAGYKFAGSLFRAQRQGNLLGISMDDAKNATAALVEGTSNFAKMSKESRTQMTLTTAKLSKLGIDGAAAAETFQFMNVVLGESAEESENFQKRLTIMGNTIGIPAKKMTKDFNAALPMLAVYGDRAVDVFTNLAAAAKAAGVETSTLLGIAKQFDTFAGAADGAAKLNALLGTQLSTTQMLMMTEDERIETLIESVQAQGIAFKDMDRFTQKAIMAAAGITDLNEANKIFGMSVSAYRENQKEMTRNAEVQKEFEDAVAATVPVMEQFKLLTTEFIISVQPFLNTLGEGAKMLRGMLSTMEPETKTAIANVAMLVGGVGAFTIALKSLAFIFGPVVASLKLMGTGLMAIGATATPAAASLATLGPASATASAGMLPLVKVFGLLALAVGGVTLAFSAYQAAKAAVLKQEAKMAAASARESEAYERASGSLAKLTEVDFTSVSLKVKQLVRDIASIGGAGDIMVKSRSTIENLAMISTGQAKDSMTGNVIQAAATNVTANVQNVFSGMKMVIEVDGKEMNGYVKRVAEATNVG
jgi:hypothetical protein